jgi:hypothetical protein
MTLRSSVHDPLKTRHPIAIHPCFYWLIQPTLPRTDSIRDEEQIGKNLPSIGKVRHKNRFKYRTRTLRNLEVFVVVTGMKIA